jgi:hypothetical protein
LQLSAKSVQHAANAIGCPRLVSVSAGYSPL